MTMFMQNLKSDVLKINHKLVNHIELVARHKKGLKSKEKKAFQECERASARLILYANNWVHNFAQGRPTAEKKSFYIDSQTIDDCCQTLEKNALYHSTDIFKEVVSLIRKMQRAATPRFDPIRVHTMAS
ncbi:hypothetical protein RYZ26_10810 [Terasakiella sp. A23]|uniref:hypothetical protein n=1 Tax=Terasakiella sp. FCG-A23 TaxID=3080561 RepID=UPI00295360E2|nr:hypothetical protein [Terasakiella sp. A23]MDV7340085.1 hypothetical protein [Terasakiella sp. A23]